MLKLAFSTQIVLQNIEAKHFLLHFLTEERKPVHKAVLIATINFL